MGVSQGSSGANIIYINQECFIEQRTNNRNESTLVRSYLKQKDS